MSEIEVAQRVETDQVQPMRIKRMCTECEEETAQRQPIEEEEEELQVKEMPGQTPEATPDLESRINSLKGGGQPLDPATRSFFEPRFGQDFGSVRVHSDRTAADIAKSINARAFTLGNHVAMGSGEYHPNSQSGRRLLGHELTHVVQQQRFSELTVVRRTPDPRLPEIVEAIRDMRNTPFSRTSVIEHLFERTGALDLSDPDNLRPIVSAIQHYLVPHHGHEVLLLFLASTDARLPDRELVTAEDLARMERTTRLMQVGPRGPYRQYGPGVLLPVLSNVARPLQPILEALGNVFENAGAFLQGLYEGLRGAVGGRQAERIARSLVQSSILNAVFPSVFLSGAVVGIAEDIADAVRGIVDLIANFSEVVSAAVEMVELLVSERGAQVASAIGREVGRAFGIEIVQLSRGNVFEFSFGLGRLIGPKIVYTVLAFLGVPELIAGMVVFRIMNVLRPLLSRLPRLARLLRHTGSGLLSGGRRQRVLLVGAERVDEFEWATGLARRGQRVTVLSPEASRHISDPDALEALRRFRGQGDFNEGRIEDLPREPVFDSIREDFPYPTGARIDTMDASNERLDRLTPGGRWTVVSEEDNTIETIQRTARARGFDTNLYQAPLRHELTPQSHFAERPERFILVVTHPR